MGGYGYVFKATRKHDHKTFAIKVSKNELFLLSEREKQSILDEVRLMKENAHPFIVKIIDDFLDSSSH
jgi:serine/threonine protein kinase